jgi:hypothetical protein
MYLEICPFLLDFLMYLNIRFQSSLWWFPGFPLYLLLSPIFVSDFINLGLFPHNFSHICQEFVNLVHFFKEPAFILLILCIFFFLVSISLIWALIISSPAILGFAFFHCFFFLGVWGALYVFNIRSLGYKLSS